MLRPIEGSDFPLSVANDKWLHALELNCQMRHVTRNVRRSTEAQFLFRIRFGPPIAMHEAIKTANAPQPMGHYSQAVRMGNLLFVSGQLPLDHDGNVVKGTAAQEAAQALQNVRAIVEAADGTIADIVQCTIYISDIAHWGEVNGIYGAFFSEVPVLPARAIVTVKEMPYGVHIEIQAIAFLHHP